MAMKNKLGAHVRGGRDLNVGLGEGKAMGCEAIQVFLTGPTTYRMPTPPPGKDEEFRESARNGGIDVFVHGSYLMNFGSPKDASRTAAANVLTASLKRASIIGAKGVVLHSGSASGDTREAGLKRVHESLLPVLEAIPEDGPSVLLEPMAGQGSMLSSKLDSIEPYWAAVEHHPKLKVCLDTAHLWGAGEDISTWQGTLDLLNAFDEMLGLDRLALIHANESMVARGSRKDRHENLDRGQMGTEPWAAFFSHPKVTCPLILETPSTRHSEDLGLLKSIREEVRGTSSMADSSE